ncbi:MAG: glycine cleavage system aminomethyltransferase GcvT [Verrucomicrobiales bacterium]|nr:glycine cleavage system aminomethyltransferase GcvT [Verrucomicrobiales bacterium]
MKQTPLFGIHDTLGARMAEFAGWQMPIQYEGIVAEHNAVRTSVGVFDISHMGQIVAEGEQVIDWLNGVLTNDSSVLGDSEGQYTLMLNENGGVIDDMIIFRESGNSFFLVVNASKIDEDFAALEAQRADGISLRNESGKYGGLAVQGPDAVKLWDQLGTGAILPERNGILRTDNFVLCRTGYTGEDGFELFAPVEKISDWFRKILDAGAKPCGLGARDTLRLEKCYPLNGNDLDPEHTPLQAGLGFFVKLKTDIDFTGRNVLESQKADGVKTRLSAIQMTGKAPPPRHGYDVIDPQTGLKVSELSSGGMSPTLQKGIAMAYIPLELAKPGTALEIGIRQRTFPAEVVKKPFL